LLNIFVAKSQGLLREELAPGSASLPSGALWIDLIEPSAEEEKLVEASLRVDVPTREEMREIEASSRLYEENGALYMTATVVTKLETDLPESSQVTFILDKDRLITNRYVDPLPFRSFIAYAEKHPQICGSSTAVLAGLLESIVNRIADVLERIGADLDAVSANVFATPRGRRSVTGDFRQIMARVGTNGDVTSKARESLVSLGRLLAFLQQSTTVNLAQDQRSRLRTLARDVLSLSDHASFLANKVSFVLEATLGMINIEQNNIIKIFSVVTVFLLPPSLIAGIFGMNFHSMPLLQSREAFWIAMGLMVVSAIVPYIYFRRRGWL
jgi:magnesium transporter